MKKEGFEQEPVEKPISKKVKKLRQKQIAQLEDEQFTKEYFKAGGIQHIICSATLTIDKQGRVTPRGVEKEKRLSLKAREKGQVLETVSTVE